MEILKKKSKVIRSQVTRFTKDAETILSSTSAIDLEEVSVLIERLRLAERQLKDADTAIEPNLREKVAEGSSHRPPLCHLLRFFELELQSRERTQEDRPDDASAKQAKGREPRVGDMVLVQENLPRLLWEAGVIVSLFSGRDGQIGSCEVRTPQGKHVRTSNSLCTSDMYDVIEKNQACIEFDEKEKRLNAKAKEEEEAKLLSEE
ncbi:hypothetical protein MTO96_032732 [Rhipicephalus appendiculatus]